MHQAIKCFCINSTGTAWFTHYMVTYRTFTGIVQFLQEPSTVTEPYYIRLGRRTVSRAKSAFL